VSRSLQRFDASYNRLSSQPSVLLNSLPELLYLNLSHNNIIIDFGNSPTWSLLSSNTKLQVLDLSHNRIDYIDQPLFNGLQNLRRLYLDNNFIPVFTSVYFFWVRDIATISMNYNNISEIFFPHAYHMIEFNMLGNSFNFTNTTIPFEKAPKLHTLRLGHPGLIYYPITFKYLTSLRYLYLKDFSQPILSSRLFADQQFLETLKVEDGKMENVNIGNMTSLTNLFFKNLPNFTRCTITNCSNLDQGFIHFQDVPNLTYVKVHDLRNLTSFGTLFYVENNNSIKYLNLSNNNIRKITLSDFHNFSKLEVLDLSFNNINFIHPRSFANLSELKHLNLTQNSLVSLVDSFLFSKSLSYLILSHNRVEFVSACWDCDLPNLQELDLSYNKIRTLERFSKPFQYFLNGNLWNCSCSLLNAISSLKPNNLCFENSTDCFMCLSSLKYFSKTLYDLTNDCKKSSNKKKDEQHQPEQWIIILICVFSAIILILAVIVTVVLCKICQQRKNDSCFKNVFFLKKN